MVLVSKPQPTHYIRRAMRAEASTGQNTPSLRSTSEQLGLSFSRVPRNRARTLDRPYVSSQDLTESSRSTLTMLRNCRRRLLTWDGCMTPQPLSSRTPMVESNASFVPPKRAFERLWYMPACITRGGHTRAVTGALRATLVVAPNMMTKQLTRNGWVNLLKALRFRLGPRSISGQMPTLPNA